MKKSQGRRANKLQIKSINCIMRKRAMIRFTEWTKIVFTEGGRREGRERGRTERI